MAPVAVVFPRKNRNHKPFFRKDKEPLVPVPEPRDDTLAARQPADPPLISVAPDPAPASYSTMISVHCFCTAMHSTSTLAPNASPVTPNALRAGKRSTKKDL